MANSQAPLNAPSAPIMEAAAAVAQTIAAPSFPILVEDLIMVHSLVTEVKAKLAGKHPSLWILFTTLFNLNQS